MSNLVLVPCPLCGNADKFLPVRITNTDAHIRNYGDLYAGYNLSQWKVCGQCGFVHQNPRPSTKALNELYLKSEYHKKEILPDRETYLNFCRWYYGPRVEFALKMTGIKKGMVFDVGFGHGGVLALFKEKGWNISGVEADDDLFQFANKTLGLIGLDKGIMHASFHAKESADIVFSNHVFEHIADLSDAMNGIVKTIKKGGYLVTIIPTYRGNKTNMSKKWMNAGHYSMFTSESLNQLLVRFGFEPVYSDYGYSWVEKDDLWHVAKYTGNETDKSLYFENPRKVQFYVNLINPLRSIFFFPFYSFYPLRVALIRAAVLLFVSPRAFIKAVGKKIKG